MIGRVTALFLTATGFAVAQIPAFPGAEGYGAYAKGGRGGDVYHVTNLNASGAGSFIDAINTVPSAGRTIVFDVSGYIRLPSGSNGTRLTSSKVTIAGQTAPGDGIGFFNNFFRISGDDIVVRHLRFRHGYYGSGGDCIDLDSGCLNAMLDHVSMQFSTDENMSSFGSPPENLTLQYSLNAWGLESHSCGGLWDQNHATSHHNLWAHNHTRNPKARPAGLLEWVNNVTFDWDIGFIMGDSTSVQNWKANVINNYFICPSGNIQSKDLVKGTVGDNGKPNFTVFLSGNLTDTNGDGLVNGIDKGYAVVEGTAYAPGTTGLTPGASGYYQSASAIAGSTAGVTTDTPLVAYKKVVSNAGALRLDAGYAGTIRDEVDTILMTKLTTQARGHVTRESDTGASNSGFGVLNSALAPVDTDQDGMPDYYETALGWTASTQDHNTLLANSGGVITGTTFFPTGTVAGYTRLEEYLHFLSIPHGTVPKNISGTPSSIQVDLRKYTAGFATSPSFAISAISNGTITQYLADGVTVSATGPIVKFAPTLNYVGRARFDFTVTDAAGSSWTQTMAVLVSQSSLPRDLRWKGTGNSWDTTTATNWLQTSNNSTVPYSDGDRVVLDQSGIAQPNVTITGTLAPTTVEVNATGNYTLGGTGALSSTGTLTKRGTGILTINNSGTNGFTGTILDAGAITLGSVTAIASGLGTGPITMNSGTVNFYDPGAGGSFTATLPNPLAINGDVTMNTGARCGTSGALSGAGTLNLFVPYVRTDWGGNPAAFTGTLNVITDADGCEFRINNAGTGAITDYGNSRIRLADKVGAYYQPNPPSGGDKTQIVQIGELSTTGTGTGVSLGGANGAADRIVHWKVGALNTNATFGGAIVNRTGPAALTKLGTGSLTLTGASTATGATTVSSGALIVAGSLGVTPVTVASGAMLAGSGTMGGSVTASSGAILSPGTAPFTGATMTVNGDLSLNGNTLYYDMSSSVAGANDKIAMNGGTLALSGTQYFQFLLLEGTLGEGTYNLITGATNSTASNVGLTHNLPTGTRQTFNVKRSAAGSNPSLVWLEVIGNPATLIWTGATSANWDTTTANNWTGASPNTFGPNDAVIFDDTSTVNNVSVPSAVTPRAITFNNAARAYTLGGVSGITSGALVKNNAGALTLTGGNSPSSTTINAGATLTFANDTVNATGLGTGPITLNGGTLTMYNNQSGFSSSTMNLVVPTGQSGTLNADSRHDIYGTLTGGGTFTFRTPWIRTNLFCDWSAFTGVINVTTDADGGDLRMCSDYYFPGFPLASVNLSDKVAMYFDGIVAGGGGTTIPVGELSGTALSTLQGGAVSGRSFTYRIGGKTAAASEVVFAGTISERATGTVTSIVKTGAGTWKLTGTGAWNGGTTVEQGTLAVTGNIASAGAVGVASGATLSLTNGSVATDAVTVASGGSFSGYGTLASDLICSGILTGRGFASGTVGTLNVGGGAFFDGNSVIRMRGGVSSDVVNVGGDLSLAGTVQVSLVAGTGFGRYPLFTYTGGLSMGAVALTGIPAGTVAKLSTAVAGQVALVIDDSDEDGLPDSWEMSNFGNLTQGANDDADGDGQSNKMEYLAGTNPKNGLSRFAVNVTKPAAGQFQLTWPSVPGKTYVILTSTSANGPWSSLQTVPAAISPATSTSQNVSANGPRRFYRVSVSN